MESIGLHWSTQSCIGVESCQSTKLRQRIIEVLEESDNMTVTDIYIKLRLEQSVASQHLAILRRAGVVITDRQGKFIYYFDKEKT